MSWSLFAIVQLGVTALGVIAALWLRNRELNKRVSAMEETQAEASEALAEAKVKLESTDDHEAWLNARVTELEGDDPVTLIQRMVLQNESKPSKEFNDELSAQLGGGSDIDASWSGLRATHHELTANLIGSTPSQHASIVELYEVFSSLDNSLAVDLPVLPDVEEGSVDQSGDERLRTENAQLQQQLESAREALLAVGEGDDQNTTSDEDLKSLLQQFTRDSRDMMICIQMLEAENLKLRNRFEENKQDAPASTERSDAESGESDEAPSEQITTDTIEETTTPSTEESPPVPTEQPTANEEPTPAEETIADENPTATTETAETQPETVEPSADSLDEKLDEVDDADIEAILASIANENEDDAA